MIDTSFWTPLHTAVISEKDRIVRALVNAGADIFALNDDGDLPLDLSDTGSKVEGLLLAEQAKLGVSEDDLVAIRNKPALLMLADVQQMIASGSDVNVRGPSGETLLHVAAASGFADVAKLLLSTPGIRVNAMDLQVCLRVVRIYFLVHPFLSFFFP